MRESGAQIGVLLDTQNLLWYIAALTPVVGAFFMPRHARDFAGSRTTF